MISIITATFNSSLTLRDCLDSVQVQQGEVEHIIIDGLSTDATAEIVRCYPHVSRFVSEPDSGIYDAMNKGIAASSGDIIGILNSDDMYLDSQVLEKVRKVFEDPDLDSCYGDLLYVDAADIDIATRYWKSRPFHKKLFHWGWMPPHPTFFVRRRVYERYGSFNPELGSAADYELMLRFLVKHEISTAYLPAVLTKMREGGVSNSTLKNRLAANAMDRKAWETNGLKPYRLSTYLKPLRKIMQYVYFDQERALSNAGRVPEDPAETPPSEAAG